MIMPDKFAFHFGDFDMVAVMFGDNPGCKIISDHPEFFIQIDDASRRFFGHVSSSH
jgi:hypothetical protein